MRNALWVLCGLAVTVPAYSAPDAGCMKSRETVLKEATKYDCPEEEAEAKAITCEGTAIKDAKRLYELVKSCHQKPKKGTAGTAMEAKPAKAGVATSTSAGDPSELPEGAHKCRGVDAEGQVLAAHGSDKSSVDCLSGLKMKVGEKLCASGNLSFTYQTYKEKWSKGTQVEARCKK